MEYKEVDWKVIGDKIRNARTESGISQTELANAVGVTNAFICQVEAGKKGVSVENLTKLSHLLKVNFFNDNISL